MLNDPVSDQTMKFALVVTETEHSRRMAPERRAEHRASKLAGGEAFETAAIGPGAVHRAGAGNVTVTEGGPYAGERETLGGYLLVETADRDEAVALAKSWRIGETIEAPPIWVAS